MNDAKQILEELEILENLLSFPIVIRQNKVLLSEGLKNNLSAVGISLKGHETSEEEFEKLIEPLGICLADISAIRIIRTIIT